MLCNFKDVLDDLFLSLQALRPFLFDSQEKPYEYFCSSSKQPFGNSNLMMVLGDFEHFYDDSCQSYHIFFLYLSLESNFTEIICDLRDRLSHC